jgi:hypothetical protein
LEAGNIAGGLADQQIAIAHQFRERAYREDPPVEVRRLAHFFGEG